jgi:outer membrane protein assembly factor BamD
MIFIKNYSWIIIKLLLITFLIISCSSNNNSEIVEKNDIEMYKNALSLSLSGKHDKAAIEFDTLNLNYPYSTLSAKAEIMTAYSLYQNNEIKKTIIKLQSFLEMNPSGELSEYAQYLLGMCYYIQISNQERDPNLSIKSRNYFKILISKYPDGKYAKDAKLKIQYINNSLASNELSIGVFYLRKNSPLAAIKRFKFIIKNYKNTNVIPETLYRLCEALLMISLEEEARQSKALLVYNFPQNRWAELSKKLFNSNNNPTEDEAMITSFKNYIKTIFD